MSREVPTEIQNDALKLSDIPPDDAEWKTIVPFAHTFSAYKVHGSFAAVANIANERRCENLTDLRTCLFFEQRRWNHFGTAPDVENMNYIRSLVSRIRLAVVDKRTP
jgi:hypothetical protein